MSLRCKETKYLWDRKRKCGRSNLIALNHVIVVGEREGPAHSVGGEHQCLGRLRVRAPESARRCKVQWNHRTGGRYIYVFIRAVYTKHQRQHRVNAATMLTRQLSLKSMETNRVTSEWGYNESYVANVIAALTLHVTLTLGVNGS